MKVVIGIDPGVTGAIAVLNAENRSIVELVDMPTAPDRNGRKQKVSGSGIARLLNPYPKDSVQRVFLERVSAMPGQGVTSMFNFGRAFGAAESAIAALSLPLSYVTPQQWKRSARLIGQHKDASRGRVLDLYPDADVRRKKDNGRADAVLIALYGHH